MSEADILALLKKEWPEWNDQTALDDYDFKAIILILKKAGVLK